MDITIRNVLFVVFLASHRLQVADSAPQQLTLSTTIDEAQDNEEQRHYRPVIKTCQSVCHYDDWFQRAKCDNRGLQAIPISTGCEKARILEVHNNNITHINSDVILGYNRIVLFDVSRNKIAFIEPGTFESAEQLENIIFSSNQLVELHSETFPGTELQLIRLSLDRNRIAKIHGQAFNGLKKLQTLTFSDNLIHYFPVNLFNDLTDLRYLHLSGNKLTHLDVNIFSGLSKLESISLDHNRLGSIPAGIFNGLTSLDFVDLSNNNLKNILHPTDLGLFHGLRSIYLNENDFTMSNLIIPFLNTSDILTFDGNPFICDCTFIQVQIWFLSKSKEDQAFLLKRNSLGCWWGARFIDIESDLSETCQKIPQHSQGTARPGKTVFSSKQLTGSTNYPLSPLLIGMFSNWQHRENIIAAESVTMVEQYDFKSISISTDTIFLRMFSCVVCIGLFMILGLLVNIFIRNTKVKRKQKRES